MTKSSGDRSGSILLFIMCISGVAGIVGTITNLVGLTSISWWIIGVVSAPCVMVAGALIFGLGMLVYTMHRHG